MNNNKISQLYYIIKGENLFENGIDVPDIEKHKQNIENYMNFSIMNLVKEPNL